MARTSFLFRTDPAVLDALRKWAEDDLRSVNGQLDFLVRKALRDAGRGPRRENAPPSGTSGPGGEPGEE